MTEIRELIEILKEENEIYNSILELANQKTAMISEENIAEIDSISKQEEQYIKDAKLVEYRREDQILKIEKTLAVQNKLSTEKIKDISSLLKYIEDPGLKEELSQTQKDFTATLTELKKINLINNTLIKDALEYISLNMNLITGASTEGTYGKTSENIEPQTRNKSMFDFKG